MFVASVMLSVSQDSVDGGDKDNSDVQLLEFSVGDLAILADGSLSKQELHMTL